MLLHRVFPYLPSAKEGEPGHPLYVHRGQGKGRWDNPKSYLAWYLASEPTSAVGESFADVGRWRDEMFEFPQIPGARKALGTYELPDDLPYVDFDDAATLVNYKMRPTQVVERNRPYTQSMALIVFEESHWKGIRWWSFHRPSWRVWCLWEIDPECSTVEHLHIGHAAVRDAAQTLVRPLITA